jgi:MFS family permease
MSLIQFIRDNDRWLAAGVLLTFISSFGQTYFISIFASEIKAEFDLSDGDWGQLYAMGTMASGFLMIWAGATADHIRVRTLAIVVILTLVMVCLAMSAVSSWWMLVVVIFGLRFTGQGMTSHIAVVAMARWYVRARGKALSVAGAGYSTGEALLPMLFVGMLASGSWRNLWVVAAVVAGLSIPILVWLLKEERVPSVASERGDALGMRGRHWARVDVVKDWRFWGLVPIITVTSIFGTALFFQQVHLADVKGLEHRDIVRLFPVYTITTGVAAVLSGLAVDRWGAVQLLPIIPIPMAVGFAIMGLSNAEAALMVGFMLVGLTGGIYGTVQGAFWPEIYGTRFIGAIKALATALMVIGSAIGPALTGWGIDAGVNFPQQMIWYAVYMVVIAVWSVFVVTRIWPDLKPSAAAV